MAVKTLGEKLEIVERIMAYIRYGGSVHYMYIYMYCGNLDNGLWHVPSLIFYILRPLSNTINKNVKRGL
jgi:hypothetical protein